MFWLLLFIYIIVLLVPFYHKRGRIDWFTPWTIYSVLLFVNTVPFLIVTHGSKEMVTEPVITLLGSRYDNVILMYIMHQTLFNIFYYISYRNLQFSKIKTSIYSYEPKTKTLLRVYIILMSLSLIYILYFINSVGGLDGLLLIYNDREALQEDRSIGFVFINFATYLAGAFHIKYLSTNGFSRIQLLINIVVAMVILSSQGGRSPFVLYLINIAVCYNYFVKKINLLSIRYIPVYFFVLFFIVGVFLLRTQGTDDLAANVILENLSVFITGNSYVDIQALIIDHFDHNTFWGGESYKGILGMLIPRSFYPSKMPIDEGVFIHEMIYDYRNVLNCKDFYTSYPPASLGAMYANFGYLGIILGGFILGAIHKYAFTLFSKSKSVFIVFIYVFLVVKFQLTVFYIAHFTYNIILLTFFYSIIKFFSRTTSGRKSYSKVTV